jgi:hypothetical protein
MTTKRIIMWTLLLIYMLSAADQAYAQFWKRWFNSRQQEEQARPGSGTEDEEGMTSGETKDNVMRQEAPTSTGATKSVGAQKREHDIEQFEKDIKGEAGKVTVELQGMSSPAEATDYILGQAREETERAADQPIAASVTSSQEKTGLGITKKEEMAKDQKEGSIRHTQEQIDRIKKIQETNTGRDSMKQIERINQMNRQQRDIEQINRLNESQRNIDALKGSTENKK